MLNKFKIGDLVVFTKRCPINGWEIGKQGCVVGFTKDRVQVSIKRFGSYKTDPSILDVKARSKARTPRTLFKFLMDRCDNNVGTCSYALFLKDKTVAINIADACHARLRSAVPVTDVVLSLKGHYDQSERKEAYKKWVHYILNKSPWAVAFRTKRTTDAIENGVYMNVDCPHDIVVAAAIALRIGSEYAYRQLPIFDALINEGLTANQAFLASSFLQHFQDAKGNLSIYYCANGGGHHVLAQSMYFDTLVSFMEKGYPLDKFKDAKTLSKGSTNYNITAPISDSYKSKRDTPVSAVIKGMECFKGGTVDPWSRAVMTKPCSFKDFANEFKKVYANA